MGANSVLAHFSDLNFGISSGAGDWASPAEGEE
jgi:hypothetical protein